MSGDSSRASARSDHSREMTSTYDPEHRLYVDEADVRGELTRVFDVCQGCRQCVALCTSFPSLFELIDRFEDHDAGWLTPAEQDRVVNECVHCGLCSVDCPYTPERDDAALDFPRLMLRAVAMRYATGQKKGLPKRPLFARFRAQH